MIPNYSRLAKMLTRDEHRGGMDGQMLYFCPSKKLTFGVGRNVEGRKVWFTQAELNHGKTHGMDAMVDLCLFHDAGQAYRDTCNLFGWEVVARWHERRVHAVINTVFCLGITRFRRFVNTIGYIKANRWEEASIELCDSKWYRDTPDRPERLAREFRLETDSDYEE